ncbi:MAG: hypothetical protein F6K18_31640 [Okeania sp. SIO2C2]|uniref:hypothetical protein n=1 Tax=Okeania sp. SIO2C2 TaxID=2607787 RepID=UPI0013B907B0|nr:hypothetical protein [Okeania sp. SIO2C2]NEP91004.1 hypothetical protein [Okeania sp. SIO2C2]
MLYCEVESFKLILGYSTGRNNSPTTILYHVRLNTYNICGPKAGSRGQKRCDPASASDASGRTPRRRQSQGNADQERECAPREAEGKEQG